MRRLNASGIDINKLAPAVFDDNGEGGFSQKQGAILDWYVPDFSGKKKTTHATKGAAAASDNNRKVVLTSNRIQLSCHMNTICMGELGEIGWYLKLELAQEKTRQGQQRKDREKERIRQPLFQFRYEGKTGKFIREIKENASVDNAVKDPNFLTGFFTPQEDIIIDEKFLSPTKPGEVGETASKQLGSTDAGSLATASNDDEKPGDVSKATAGGDVSRDINSSQIEDLFDRRRKWGRGIAIYRLVEGKFQPKELDEEIKKQQQLEEERKRKSEEEERNSRDGDAFKNNIKSRKALQVAINDKSTPPAIRNLRMTMNFVMVALLALAISEYTIISAQFKDINENFNLI